MSGNLGFLVFLALLETVGLLCLVHLWRRRDGGSVAKRLAWSLALVVPLLGPIFYGALFTPLSPLADGERAGGGDPTSY